VSIRYLYGLAYKSLSQRKAEKPIPKYFKKMQFDDDVPLAGDWKKERGEYLAGKHGLIKFSYKRK